MGLFKPLQAFTDIYFDYQLMLGEIQAKLIDVDSLRGKAGIAGTGEIASLAATYLLNAEIICSNNYLIEDVIRELPLHIFINGDDSTEPVLITHHRLLDFCRLVVDGDVLSREYVRKFYQIAYIELKRSLPESFRRILSEFNETIPTVQIV